MSGPAEPPAIVPTPKFMWGKSISLKLFIIIFSCLISIELLLYFISTHFLLHYGFFIGASLFLGLMILAVFWYFVLAPLFYLQHKLEAYEKNDHHPEQYLTIPRYKDEVNIVIIKVNALLRKLGDSYRNIKAHEAILEFRIDERTKELSQLANYDIITELPNQNLLKEYLAQAMAESEQEQNNSVIMILELLDFHEITNAYGHSVGNLFLKEVGKYLTDNLPAHTVIAHTSTTRFAIARNKIHSTSQITNMAQWMLDLFTKPMIIASHNICTTINIGIAVYPNDAKDAETLIVNANLALNRAKANTPNSFQFYETGMNASIESRKTTLVDLHYALERNELKIFYQPQVDLRTQKIIGAEALIRWVHPEKGLIPPSLFVPLAEESGLIIIIGEWVLETVCQQIKAWQKEGLPPLCIAVNLSALQFRQPGIIETVNRIVNKNGIDPRCLELEITESAVMSNMEYAISTLKALHALGTPIALDDFGTGYSSLSYVKRFPIQKLKVDQSFVREIEENPNGNHLADIIIQLGKTMNLRTIAEGIETKAQAQYLAEKGCDEGQGYLYGKPTPPEQFAKLFETKD